MLATILDAMKANRLTPAKRRVLDHLKRGQNCTAPDLAVVLSMSTVAVRQHLLELEAAHLVTQRVEAPSGRGRPPVVWSLTAEGHGLFPDGHSELTVDVLSIVQQVFGDAGMQRVIGARALQQIEDYRNDIPGTGAPLADRVQALAVRRTEEGYMAEVQAEDDGAFLLIEHHCPICEAAKSCQGLCQAELVVFEESLGPSARVERVQHLLSGDERCVYRITPAVQEPQLDNRT